MIMGSWQPLVIGQRYIGILDNQSVMHAEQPYVVLRESTAEEWFEEYEAEVGKGNVPMSWLINAKRGNAKFYEVSVD
jgi:hypothetical protein